MSIDRHTATRSARRASARGGWRSWAILGLVTVAITVAVTLLSASGGGFASGEAMAVRETTGFVGWPIAIHLATVVPALLLGPVILRRNKGDARHKMLGRIWAALMLVTATSTLFIRSPGAGIAGTGFSFIHIFTVWTFGSLPLATYAIRKGDVEGHRKAMTGLYFGLCIAGAFSLIPGRVLGSWVFG